MSRRTMLPRLGRSTLGSAAGLDRRSLCTASAASASFCFLQPLNARKEKGIDIIHDPLWNKGTAISRNERERLGIRGLLPYQVKTLL